MPSAPGSLRVGHRCTGRRPTWATCPSSRPTSSSPPWASSWVSSAPWASWRCSASSPGGSCMPPVARDVFGRLICTGLFTFVAFSVFQNAGMTMGIMPITGIPLPFVSYGGTAVLVLLRGRGTGPQRRRPSEDAMTDGQPRRGGRRAGGEPPAFRVMDVEDVSLDLPSPFPPVTLVESEPPLRTLVFPVGLTEGTALALALRRMDSPRPMTHELFIAGAATGAHRGDRRAPDRSGPGQLPGRARPHDTRPGACGSSAAPLTGWCWPCGCR